MRIIGQAHSLLHGSGVVRIQTDIRVGSRTDKKQTIEDKIAVVQALLNGQEDPLSEGEELNLDNTDVSQLQEAMSAMQSNMNGTLQPASLSGMMQQQTHPAYASSSNGNMHPLHALNPGLPPHMQQHMNNFGQGMQ